MFGVRFVVQIRAISDGDFSRIGIDLESAAGIIRQFIREPVVVFCITEGDGPHDDSTGRVFRNRSTGQPDLPFR